jgi:repressor of nif and glnA expression
MSDEETGLDRRRFDLLRLVNANEPIGSIRLVELLQRRGYSIKDRTVRLMLSELDEAGLTTKVRGKGRRLTGAGRAELERGDVSGRLAQVRERIATLQSRVSYDPGTNAGDLILSEAVVAGEEVDAALADLKALADAGIGPVLTVNDPVEGGHRLGFPSSVTLGGSFLVRGISSELQTAGLMEYDPADDRLLRYVDAINGEGSTMDVVRLLIEAGRTGVGAVVDGETDLLVVDNREFPLASYEEAESVATALVDSLGGVLDIRRPREDGPFPGDPPGWDFASLTYAGVGELALALLAERGRLREWETLAGVRPREELAAVTTVEAGRD